MSGLSQIVGSTLGVAHIANVNASGKLSVVDSAVATALSGTLAVSDTNVVSALEAQLSVSDSDVLTALAPLASTLAVADSAVATALAPLSSTLAVADSAVASALAGTLSVSAPTITTTSAIPKSAVNVLSGGTESTTALDLSDAKKIAVFGNLNDTTGSIKIEVSRDNVNYFENQEASIFINASGDFYKTIELEARYVIFKYTNGSGSTKVLTLNTSYKK